MKNKTQTTAVAAFSLLVAANLMIIWGNSMVTREGSATESGFMTSLLMRLLPSFVDYGIVDFIIRKFAHLCEFALLGGLSFSLTYSVCAFDLEKTWSYTAVPVIGCLLAASTDETIQIFSGRGNSVADVALDFAGSVAGIAVVFAVLKLRSRRSVRRDASLDPDDQ